MRLYSLAAGVLLLAAPVYPATANETILRIQREIQSGDLAGADRELARALAADPRNGGLYNLRGIIQATRGETAQAEQSFQRASELSPKLVNAYLNLARASEILGEHDPKALDRAIATFRKLLVLAPTAQEARVELARLLSKQGQLAEARTEWEALTESDPQNIEPLMNLASITERQHEFKAALGYLAHARALKPDYAPAHFWFGVVCIELDLPIEAKKALQTAIDLDPENAAYNYARGSVEMQGKSAWEAAPYFRKFVAAQPNDPRGHFALGASLFASQDYAEAKAEMTLIAGNRETAAGAQYFLGRIAKAEGDWTAAADHLTKSIAAAPEYPDSHAELGLAKMHSGDLPGAREELDRALRIQPDSYLANANLLALYQRTKDPRFEQQQQKLRELDTKRSEKQELMIRTLRIEPQLP